MCIADLLHTWGHPTCAALFSVPKAFTSAYQTPLQVGFKTAPSQAIELGTAVEASIRTTTEAMLTHVPLQAIQQSWEAQCTRMQQQA